MRKILLIAVIAVMAVMVGCKDGGDKTCDCTVKLYPFGSPCGCGLAQCGCVEDKAGILPIMINNVPVRIKLDEYAGVPTPQRVVEQITALFVMMDQTKDNPTFAIPHFQTIIDRGLMIVVKDRTGNRYVVTDGNTLDVRATFIADEVLSGGTNYGRFQTAINTMAENQTFTQR